jgi:subtilisin family serine protease
MKNIIFAAALMLAASVATAGEYIVKFKGIASQKKLSALESNNAALKTVIPQLNMAVVATSQLQTADDIQLAMGDDVEYVAKNGSVKLFAEKPKKDKWLDEVNMLWGMQAINLADAYTITKGSKDIIVAVTDTGAWMRHSELNQNIWVNKGETGKDANGKDKSKNKKDDDGNGFVDDVNGFNFETDTSDPTDSHYHGTHVSGTIGGVGGNGSIVGVAGQVSLMELKFIGGGGEGSDEDAIQSIVYAADNGARIINASWGDDVPNPALYDAIKYAQSKGVLFVAAAGNDGRDHDKQPNYPSGYDLDNIIVVGAAGSADGQLAGFSNYGAKSVNIAAPGDNIYSSFNPMYSTLYCGSGGLMHFYCLLSGTSMAAPHVAGALAMIYSVNPKLTYLQAKEILLSTAAPKKKLAGKVSTGAMLDVGAAVRKAQTTLTPVPMQ